MNITPKQFNILATKDDLKNYATLNDLHIFKDEILTAVDHVVKKLDTIEHAFVSNQVAHNRFENRIKI